MMARKFQQYAENSSILVFACGVSNSKEISSAAFQREFDTLKRAVSDHPDKTVIYFSTSSMYDPASVNSPYVQHKLAMERFIASKAEKYIIFRVSQVIGKATNKTLVNYLIENIKQDIPVQVWRHASRNLISGDDVFKLVRAVIDSNHLMNQTVNIANQENITMPRLIKLLGRALECEPKVEYVDAGMPFGSICIEPIQQYIEELNIQFTDDSYYIDAIQKEFM